MQCVTKYLVHGSPTQVSMPIASGPRKVMGAYTGCSESLLDALHICTNQCIKLGKDPPLQLICSFPHLSKQPTPMNPVIGNVTLLMMARPEPSAACCHLCGEEPTWNVKCMLSAVACVHLSDSLDFDVMPHMHIKR